MCKPGDPVITVAFMIYKSVRYYNFILDQLSKYRNDVPFCVLCIANDPYPEVMDAINAEKRNILVKVQTRARPRALYLQDVYESWNNGVIAAPTELVCLINSDMALSDHWLDALYYTWLEDHSRLPTSRLIESGNLPSPPGVESIDFGKTLSELDEQKWQEFCRNNQEAGIDIGQLFMPVLFERTQFLDAGGYGGNQTQVHSSGPGAYYTKIVSGDKLFFDKLSSQYNKKHVVVNNSIVYHIQEGEMMDRD